MVGLCLDGNQPKILVRQRPKLVEEFTYEFRQPYHTAEKLDVEKARRFISQIESAAIRLAEEAIRGVEVDLRKEGYELSYFGLLLASGRPLPSLENILLSHALVHAADGELFRRALIHASERCHIAVFTIAERELVNVAYKTLKIDGNDLSQHLAALGKQIGPPWSQDEKLAAIVAWLALLNRVGPRSAKPASELS